MKMMLEPLQRVVVSEEIPHKKKGRRCKYPGCNHVMSIYNLDDECCFIHQRKLQLLDFDNENKVKFAIRRGRKIDDRLLCGNG